MNNLEEVIKEKNNEIETLEKENWQLKVENVFLQKMSAELDESSSFTMINVISRLRKKML